MFPNYKFLYFFFINLYITWNGSTICINIIWNTDLWFAQSVATCWLLGMNWNYVHFERCLTPQWQWPVHYQGPECVTVWHRSAVQVSLFIRFKSNLLHIFNQMFICQTLTLISLPKTENSFWCSTNKKLYICSTNHICTINNRSTRGRIRSPRGQEASSQSMRVMTKDT